MDWLFNLQIPGTTPTTLVIRPACKLLTTYLFLAKTFVTGIA